MYFERFGKIDIFYKKGGVEGVSSVGVIVVIDSSCCNHNKNSWRLMWKLIWLEMDKKPHCFI